jgi:protein involved in polysaccharide export with SLBB domain
MLLAFMFTPSLTYKLGFLYKWSDSSWLVESFSQFKLAIHDVNANSTLGPNDNLTFVVFDSQGDSSNALAGNGTAAVFPAAYVLMPDVPPTQVRSIYLLTQP